MKIRCPDAGTASDLYIIAYCYLGIANQSRLRNAHVVSNYEFATGSYKESAFLVASDWIAIYAVVHCEIAPDCHLSPAAYRNIRSPVGTE